jgi:hypothetical protein
MATQRETAWRRFLAITAAMAQEAEPEALPEPLSVRWMTISYNTAEEATDYLVMNGEGWLVDGQLAASGSYNHYAGSEADYCETPKELLGYGIWKTDELGSVELIGEYGAFAAGTIVINGSVTPKEIQDAQAVPTRLTLNASLQSGGLITVEPEGALVQLSSGLEVAPVTVPSDCGFETGGGQVEFNTYEPAIKIPEPKDESKDNSGGGGSSGGGNNSGGGNSGSTDPSRAAKDQADQAEDKAENKADQAEKQAKQNYR